MKKVLIACIGMISSICIHAQQEIKEVSVKSTKNIVINTGIPVYIYKSDTARIIIKTAKNHTNPVNVHTDNEGVYFDGGFGSVEYGDQEVILIYAKNIQEIVANGPSTVVIADEFTTDQLMIVASGSSTITGKVVARQAILNASGASDIRLEGSANEVDAVASGSSDLQLLNFPVQRATVSASGASDIYLDASESLDAVATGASDIYYKSEPTSNMTSNASGASDIRKYNGGDKGEKGDKGDKDWNYPNNHPYYYNYDYNTENNTDTPRVNTKNNSRRFAARPKDMFSTDRYRQDLVWMGIDLGVDGLVDLSNGFDFQPQGDYNFMEMNYWRNTNVRINFFEWRFNLVKNVFNIVTGLGWDFQHYAFSQKVRLDEADDYPGQTFPTPIIGLQDTVHSINRSRLAVQYFNIPLFLNFRTKKTEKHRKQFNFTIGVVAGIKTGSSSRIAYTENGYDAHEEKFDDFNLNTFTATGMVRIKYSFFSIYASYTFTPMFAHQQPNLFPVSLGLTLLSW